MKGKIRCPIEEEKHKMAQDAFIEAFEKWQSLEEEILEDSNLREQYKEREKAAWDMVEQRRKERLDAFWAWAVCEELKAKSL
jgi:hypothetical protein